MATGNNDNAGRRAFLKQSLKQLLATGAATAGVQAHLPAMAAPLAASKGKTMHKHEYLIFTHASETALVMSYASRSLWDWLDENARLVKGGSLATSLFNGREIDYANIAFPPIGLVPDTDLREADYRPGGKWFEFFNVSMRMFMAPRLKAIMDKHKVEAFYTPAYLDTGEEKLPYHHFVPLLALDAIDWEKSDVKMDPDDANREAVLQGKRKHHALDIYKLVLDYSKIPSGTPFFVLARNYMDLMCIRADIAREIERERILGVETLPIDDSGRWDKRYHR